MGDFLCVWTDATVAVVVFLFAAANSPRHRNACGGCWRCIEGASSTSRVALNVLYSGGLSTTKSHGPPYKELSDLFMRKSSALLIASEPI
ncbi:hypothetical protein Tco_0321095 [Tanacetum coccineum]